MNVIADPRCKGVHIRMDKETHMRFKMRLVEHGISMQEVFEEFARLVGVGNLSANNLIERLIKTNVKNELASVGLTPMKRGKPRRLSELSADAMYDLINEEETE